MAFSIISFIYTHSICDIFLGRKIKTIYAVIPAKANIAFVTLMFDWETDIDASDNREVGIGLEIKLVSFIAR
jgi:hypothetical protein